MQQWEWVGDSRQVGVTIPIAKVVDVVTEQVETNNKHPNAQYFIG